MATRNSSPVTQTDTATNAGSVVSAGTTTASLVAANPGRVALYVSNDHATQVAYLSLGAAAAVASSGLRVSPGATVTITGYTGAVQVIASGATTAVCVAEI